MGRCEARDCRATSRRHGAWAGEEVVVEMRNLLGAFQTVGRRKRPSAEGGVIPELALAISGRKPLLSQASSHSPTCETVGRRKEPRLEPDIGKEKYGRRNRPKTRRDPPQGDVRLSRSHKIKDENPWRRKPHTGVRGRLLPAGTVTGSTGLHWASQLRPSQGIEGCPFPRSSSRGFPGVFLWPHHHPD